MTGSLLLLHPGLAGSGGRAKGVGASSVQLLPIQRLGVRKGARGWEAENRGLKPSLSLCLPSVSEGQGWGGGALPVLALIMLLHHLQGRGERRVSIPPNDPCLEGLRGGSTARSSGGGVSADEQPHGAPVGLASQR